MMGQAAREASHLGPRAAVPSHMPGLPAQLLTSPLFALFTIIGVGAWAGSLRFRGVSLGASGVLFVALLVGHCRQYLPSEWLAAQPDMLTLPRVLTDLGLLLFVYPVGLQAGPQFLSMYRRRGKAYFSVAAVSIGAASLTTLGLAMALHIRPTLAGGVFTGALTCTPALAAVRDIAGSLFPADVGQASVGYGIAYPFSTLTVVLLVQLLPSLLRTPVAQAVAQARSDAETLSPSLHAVAYRVTNPNVAGRTVAQLQEAKLVDASYSRLKREGTVVPVTPSLTIQLRDVLMAVAVDTEHAKLEAVLGAHVDEPMDDPTGIVTAEDIVVSRPAAFGKRLGDLDPAGAYGVVVTRVRREGLEFTPEARLEIEPGDTLRVVGARSGVAAFQEAVGQEERRLDETSLVPFVLGIALGAVVGMLPLPMPGGLQTRLGAGGGAFIVALALGHFGHIGKWRVYVPTAAKLLARELGLVIFLAGAGLEAGQHFASVVREAGPQIILAGAVVTLVGVGTALFMMLRVLKWNLLTAAGALGGVMTSSPGLSAATALADTDSQAVAFAGMYPVAIIAKIVVAQLIPMILRQ